MLAETLAAVAAQAATTLAAAMATDAWHGAKAAFARLFGHSGPEQQAAAEVRLDTDAELVTSAGEDERDEVRRELVPTWRRQLVRLLEEHPDAEAALRELIAQVTGALPMQQRAWIEQTIIASGQGATAMGVAGGNLYYGVPPTRTTAQDEQK